jgi:hypothetical protein
VNAAFPIAATMRADDPAGLVAVLAIMDSSGCRFIVKPPDGLGQDGPLLPAWCDDVIAEWFELIVAAFRGQATGHRLYGCGSCGWLMMLSRERRIRACPICAKAHTMAELAVRFVDPPTRRRATAAPQRRDDPVAAAPVPKPLRWTCSHSLTTPRPDGAIRCSYCNQEVTP